MKNFIKNSLVLSSLLAIQVSNAVLPTTIEGTGLTLEIPENLHRYSLGTSFISQDNTQLLTFMSAKHEKPLEDRYYSSYRYIYPHFITDINTKNLKGKIYQRQQPADGGTWQGWLFIGEKDNQDLIIMYSNENLQDTTWQKVPDFFKTIDWQPKKINATQAFQAKILVPNNYELKEKFFGGLGLTAKNASNNSQNILILPMPKQFDFTKNSMFDICSIGLRATHHLKDNTLINSVNENNNQGCDIHLPDGEYEAILMTPQEGVYMVMSKGSLKEMRTIATSIKPLKDK